MHGGIGHGGDVFGAGRAAFAGLQTLLHGVIAADDIDDEASSLELARACLRKLESSAAKRRRSTNCGDG